jgi:hypothetical protein
MGQKPMALDREAEIGGNAVTPFSKGLGADLAVKGAIDFEGGEALGAVLQPVFVFDAGVKARFPASVAPSAGSDVVVSSIHGSESILFEHGPAKAGVYLCCARPLWFNSITVPQGDV